MRCVIRDKATPKTGGVTNRAQPTAASGFAPGISKSGFPPSCLVPIASCLNFTKRTQLPTTNIHSTIYNTQSLGPISARPHPHFCETNPIYRTAGVSPAFPAPNMRNEPNPSTGTACRAPVSQNEPNSRIPSAPPPPVSAKRTQSHKANSQKMQNEPNSTRPTANSQKMRNEPNLTRPTPKKCETNPIPAWPTTQICETNPITTRPTAQKCETNPIFPPRASCLVPRAPNTRNEPNYQKPKQRITLYA